jgi:hypothetical protein
VSGVPNKAPAPKLYRAMRNLHKKTPLDGGVRLIR